MYTPHLVPLDLPQEYTEPQCCARTRSRSRSTLPQTEPPPPPPPKLEHSSFQQVQSATFRPDTLQILNPKGKLNKLP